MDRWIDGGREGGKEEVNEWEVRGRNWKGRKGRMDG